MHNLSLATFHVTIFVLLIFSFHFSVAQNLVPNPSFENPMPCPMTFGAINVAFPWVSPTSASPDYFHVCGQPPWFTVPSNYVGWQNPRTGGGYAGEIFVHPSPNTYREYITSVLTEPLEAGMPYQVSYWISLTDNFPCGSPEFGAYFSVNPPPNPGGNYQGILNYIPQVNPNIGFVTDTMGWTEISGCFVAQGGERYITIGNFSPAGTPTDPACGEPFPESFYYIDDVSVELGGTEELDIDLGGPVDACYGYMIDPDIPDANYTWSDGSHDSVLWVSTTGLYAVTILIGCAMGTDTIEVNILGEDDVELGPDEVNICAGESYTVTLDPGNVTYLWQDGSTDPSYTITTSGLYSVTQDDGCQLTTDAIYLNVISPPSPFNIDSTLILCDGDEIEFHFDPGLGEFHWQDDDNSANYTISTGGHYALTISNVCGEESADVDITGLTPPDITIGPDTLTLCNGESVEVQLNADPDHDMILWSDGSDDLSMTIHDEGTYAVTVTNVCGMDEASMVVHIDALPFFDLGTDTILCDAQLPIVLQPGEFQNAHFLWQDSSSADTFLVSTAGRYAVSVTNACGTYSDEINISIQNHVPPVDFGPDLQLCPDDVYVLHAPGGTAHYLWQDSSTLDSFLVVDEGIYFLSISNACSQSSDTIMISYHGDIQQLSLPDTIRLCQGNETVIDPGIADVSYAWSDGSVLNTLVVHTPGMYSLTISNACGAEIDTFIVSDQGSLPTISLGQDVALCQGDSIILSPVATDVTDWSWSNGTTDSYYIITTSEMIMVEVSNACGTAADTLQSFTLPDVPLFTLGGDTSLCSGQSIVLNIPVANVDVLWSDGLTDSVRMIQFPGIYFATISNSCGELTDTIDISSLPSVPVLNLGIDQSLCPGEEIILNPNIPDVSYTWQDSSHDPVYIADHEGSYILTIANSCGTATDTVTITESSEGPAVNLGPDIVGCQGDVVTLISDISGVNFEWQDGSVLPYFITSTSGTYILNVSNNCGSDADTIDVNLNTIAPNIDLGPDTILCTGSHFILSAAQQDVNLIEWQDGSTDEQFIVTSAGSYSCQVSNQCGHAVDTVLINYLDPPPAFDLGPDTILCEGETLLLSAPATSASILWQDGSQQSTFLANNSQVYSLQLSNQCGQVSDDMILQYDTLTPYVVLPPEMMICPGESIELNVTQSFPANYLWSNGSMQPTQLSILPGNYAVTVSTTCESVEAETEVIFSDTCFTAHDFYVPNLFSPNGDNVNDFFFVSWSEKLNVTSVDVRIFDRWGNLVFLTDEPNPKWEGDFRGKMLDPGVYAYRIEIHFLEMTEEKTVLLHGDVTLVK